MTIGLPIDNRRLNYGNIVDPKDGTKVDEVLAVYMKAPYTYTMEDVVEINCHGSSVALRKTLELVLEKGAILAEKGEFTKRAFLNGRIDLSQAEAVIDLIQSKTDRGFEIAMEQMEGSLSRKVSDLRSVLMDLLVDITVNLDYPEEDIEEITYDRLKKSLLQIDDELKRLLKSADTGRLIREGLNITIIGKPNVGKSSLMNAFLRESRAIVTEIPGTTRDIIEESLNIKGIPVKITDTAGIRETQDVIEKIGIQKSKEAFNRADLVVFVLDASENMTKEDFEIMEHLDSKKTIILMNKQDRGQKIKEEDLYRRFPSVMMIPTSIIENKGLNELEDRIVSMVFGGKVKQEDSLMVTNIRQIDLLRKSRDEIEMAFTMCEREEALDFIEVNVKQAFEYLGEIIGEAVSDSIIDEVFSRFCLGK